MVIGRPQSLLVHAARERNLVVREHEFRGDLDPRSLYAAYRTARAFKPDLIVVNFNKEGWQFGLCGKMLRVPVVARHGYPLLRNRVHHRILATLVIDHLIVNAPSLKSHYSQLGFSTSKTDIILNGVDLTDHRIGELKSRLGLSGNVLLIAGAGRLESQKRFDLFLEAARQISGWYTNAHFVIFGEGPLKSEIEKDARRLEIADHLHLPGFAPDFAGLIGDADLFLLTSENEGTPNVLLEAMAAGVPALAFEVGAVPEVLSGPLRENMFDFPNTSAMANRARELLSSADIRKSVSLAMKTRVVSEFALDASMKKYEQMFLMRVSR